MCGLFVTLLLFENIDNCGASWSKLLKEELSEDFRHQGNNVWDSFWDQVYHLVGDLHPAPGEPRRFAQVFIMDTAQAAAELAGMEMNSSCFEELFQKLIDHLKQHHPHTRSFEMMHQIEEEAKEKRSSRIDQKEELQLPSRLGSKMIKDAIRKWWMRWKENYFDADSLLEIGKDK